MQTANASPAPSAPVYPGFNAILMGPPGTGKTFALSTLAEAGLETFVVFLEPGLESLTAAWADKGKPIPSNVHWNVLSDRVRSFEDLRKQAETVGKFDQKFLANYKDPKRGDFNRFEALYSTLNNFVDQRGVSFGSVEHWGTDRVICIDGMTGIGKAALDMMTGDRIVRDKPDFGIAQNNIQNLIDKLAIGCKCHFVLIAHIERLSDDVLGGMKLQPSLPGKALQATIAQPFSDVILTKREGASWYWDTADSAADLKTRNLAIQSKLPADFRQIVAKWQSRKLAAEGGSK